MTYMKMSYWLIYTVYTVHTQQYIILYMCLIDSCLINLIYSAPFVLTPVSFVLCCLLYIISYMVSYWLYHYCNFELLTRFPWISLLWNAYDTWHKVYKCQGYPLGRCFGFHQAENDDAVDFSMTTGVGLAVVGLVLAEADESCRQFEWPKLRYPPYLPNPYEKKPLASVLLLLLGFSTNFQCR